MHQPVKAHKPQSDTGTTLPSEKDKYDGDKIDL
jgi:hypothetical protein